MKVIEDAPPPAPEPVSQEVVNARLAAGCCPECGAPDLHTWYAPSNFDPGDADPRADCRNCGWGY